MKKPILSLIVLLAIAISRPAMAQTTWAVDPSHSNITFAIDHLMVSEVTGKFAKFDGTLVSSKADFTDATLNSTIDVNSVNTEEPKRDGHLKSPDFFDAAKFPQITFQSTAFQKVGEGKYKIAGNLTIKGVTKPIVLDATFRGTSVNPFTKITTAGFKATGTLNREDFGLKWNAALESGGVMVGKEVRISISTELQKKS